MNRLEKIINEEFNEFIREHYDEEDYSHHYKYNDKYDELLGEIFWDFLYDNNEDMSKRIPWILVNANQVKQIWEYFIKYKSVRNTRGLEKIAGIMYNNVIKLDILTYLSGHTPSNPDQDFEDNIGNYVDMYIKDNLRLIYDRYGKEIDPDVVPYYEDPNQLKLDLRENYQRNVIRNRFLDNLIINDIINSDNENNVTKIREILVDELIGKFYDYATDKNGTDIMSDYGLEPLQKLALELSRTSDHNQMIVVIDKMLNVVHQRSDMASWFVNGGSSALSDISGYFSDDDNTWETKSTISGDSKPTSYYR